MIESWEDRLADIEFGVGSSVVTESGSAISFVPGSGKLAGDPCLQDACPFNGYALLVIVKAAMGPYVISNPEGQGGGLSLNFSGSLRQDGTFEAPAQAVEASVCGVVGEPRGMCLVGLQLSGPLTGKMDFDGGRASLRAVVSSSGTALVINLVGAITNRPPTARAGVAQRVPCVDSSGAQVVLDGSASSDPDGDKLSPIWRAVGGPLVGREIPEPLWPGQRSAILAGQVIARELRAEVTLPAGRHQLQLMVTDRHMKTSVASVAVVVGGAAGCGRDAGQL